MTADRGLPITGYALEQVYSNELQLSDKPIPKGQAEDDGEIGFAWDWRIVEKNVFEVKIVVSIEPAGDRDELAKAAVIGRFRQLADTPTVDLTDFVKLQAPAILMPYARHFISLLTMNSIYGCFYLPPINVAYLMKDFDGIHSQGAKQLQIGERSAKPHLAKSQVGRKKKAGRKP